MHHRLSVRPLDGFIPAFDQRETSDGSGRQRAGDREQRDSAVPDRHLFRQLGRRTGSQQPADRGQRRIGQGRGLRGGSGHSRHMEEDLQHALTRLYDSSGNEIPLVRGEFFIRASRRERRSPTSSPEGGPAAAGSAARRPWRIATCRRGRQGAPAPARRPWETSTCRREPAPLRAARSSGCPGRTTPRTGSRRGPCSGDSSTSRRSPPCPDGSCTAAPARTSGCWRGSRRSRTCGPC